MKWNETIQKEGLNGIEVWIQVLMTRWCTKKKIASQTIGHGNGLGLIENGSWY